MDADVMPTVDAGSKRTYADALKLQGEDNTSTLAAVTRRALMWQRGVRTDTGALRPTPLEMNDFINDNPRIRTSAELASKLATRSLLPASIIGLCHWLFSDLDPDDAEWFLNRTADGDGLAADDPISALRNRIVKMRVGGGRVNETDARGKLLVPRELNHLRGDLWEVKARMLRLPSAMGGSAPGKTRGIRQSPVLRTLNLARPLSAASGNGWEGRRLARVPRRDLPWHRDM